MELPPEGATDWHYHTEVADFFVCLKGAIRVETRNPEEMILLQPGQQAEVKPGKVHRVVNSHTERVEYLLVQGVGAYDFVRSV